MNQCFGGIPNDSGIDNQRIPAGYKLEIFVYRWWNKCFNPSVWDLLRCYIEKLRLLIKRVNWENFIMT